MNYTGPGRLVVVSGPSGAGKSTVLRRLLSDPPVPLEPSVSATTRKPRPGEIDGVDYHFLTHEQFEQHRASGDFIECFQVFGRDDWYGTLRSEVEPRLADGRWVLLEIDVQGARQVVNEYPEAVTIFLGAASLGEIERRLRGRNTETETQIRQRLDRAQSEMTEADRYRYQVVNDDVDRAVQEIRDILTSLEVQKHA